MIFNSADSLKVGSSNADKVYVGNNLVFTKSVLGEFPNAEIAFSVRQLTNGDLNVVRVKRSSDNAESDFKASDLTDGTVETYVGSGNDGYVAKWYDQSGNDNHASVSSSTNSHLPYKIVSSGVYLGHIEIGEGSVGLADGLGLNTFISNPNSASTIVSAYSATGSTNGHIVSSNPYGNNLTYAGKDSGKYSIRNPFILRGTTAHDTNSNSAAFFMGGSQSYIFSSQGATAPNVTLMANGNAGDGSIGENISAIFGNSITGYAGKAFELILYKFELSNVSSLINNQREHFSI